MVNILEDVRYGARMIRRNVLSSAVVIATLMAGVGVTTAVVSVVNAVLLQPLPFSQSERVVRVGLASRGGGLGRMSYPQLQDYKRASRAFSDLSAAAVNGMTLTQGAEARHLVVAYVDEAYARVFRVQPAVGRFFLPSEHQAGGAKAIMFSNPFWRSVFGADPSIVGRTVSIDNEPRVVVEVCRQCRTPFRMTS